MKRNAEKNRLDRLQLAKHKQKKTQINYIEKKIEEGLKRFPVEERKRLEKEKRKARNPKKQERIVETTQKREKNHQRQDSRIPERNRKYDIKTRKYHPRNERSEKKRRT